jgi:hypothetical protein
VSTPIGFSGTFPLFWEEHRRRQDVVAVLRP